MTDLSPEDRQEFISMTDQVLNDNMEKKEQITKELSGLKECKEKAEDACEHTRLDYIETSSSWYSVVREAEETLRLEEGSKLPWLL